MTAAWFNRSRSNGTGWDNRCRATAFSPKPNLLQPSERKQATWSTMTDTKTSIVLSTLLAATLSFGNLRAELPKILVDQIDALVELEMQAAKIPGLSLAIGLHGRLQFSRGYGWADLENRVEASPSTVYRTASIAKPMTAVAILQLFEQGKLELDESIQTYCPEFPEKQSPVTIRQLLGHLGGIRHYREPNEQNGTEHFFSVGEAIQIFSTDPLIHEPGSKYSYTTYGYNLLGCAVEGASGKTYEDYMTESIFGPALMIQTRVDDHYAIIPHRARGYLKVDREDIERLPPDARKRVQVGQLLRAPLHDTSMKIPGGGLVASVSDLVHFALAVESGRLVNKKSIDLMWTTQKTSAGEPTGYGLGWQIGKLDDHTMISHGGGQAGTRTWLAILPDAGIVYAIACNLQGTDLQTLNETLGRILLD